MVEHQLVGIVCEGIRNITRRIVSKGFGGNNRVVADLLDGSCRYSGKAIISIAHFGRVCKYQEKTAAPEGAAGKLNFYNFIFN